MSWTELVAAGALKHRQLFPLLEDRQLWRHWRNTYALECSLCV